MKYWEIIADKLSAAGWSWGYCSKATFPVGLYGEKEAFRLAVAARRAGLRNLGDIH